jgi:hypothetical protein
VRGGRTSKNWPLSVGFSVVCPELGAVDADLPINNDKMKWEICPCFFGIFGAWEDVKRAYRLSLPEAVSQRPGPVCGEAPKVCGTDQLATINHP